MAVRHVSTKPAKWISLEFVAGAYAGVTSRIARAGSGAGKSPTAAKRSAIFWVRVGLVTAWVIKLVSGSIRFAVRTPEA